MNHTCPYSKMHSFQDNDTKSRKMPKISRLEGTDPRLRDWTPQTKKCRRLTTYIQYLYPELTRSKLRTILIC